MDINPAALTAIRELSGLSQAELARRANISQGYISEIEKGAKRPSPSMVLRIAETLGVPVAALRGKCNSGDAA